MKKTTLFGWALFTGLSLGAQNGPIDFESTGFGANFTWTVFENNGITSLSVIQNPDPTGINTSATVASIPISQLGAPWAGCETQHGSDIGSWTISSSNHIIRIMVWKSVISDVGIKLVKPDGWSLGEIKKSNTVTGAWEQLEFDFTAHIGQTYDQIVIFPDFINGRTSDHVVYFDNVYGPSASVGIEEDGLNKEVSLYPNPSNGRYNLESNSNLEKVEVLSLDGRVLFTAMPNTNNYTVEIPEFANGIYIMRIQANSKTEIHRVVKSN